MKKLTILLTSICVALISCEKEDPKVNADFSVANDVIEVGTTVIFTDLSSGGVKSWLWIFEGGTPNTSELQNPSITYNTTGMFDVSLTARNASKNGTKMEQNFITVYDELVADFSAAKPYHKEGGTIEFSDDSEGDPTNWTWYFEGGTPATSTSQNPSVTYSEDGVFDVKLVISNSFTSDSTTMNSYITIYDLYDGLVAYFPFSESADDLSATEIDGTINGAALTTDRFESSNSALLFDGIDDYVFCTADNRSITDKFTISVWIKSTSTGSIRSIVNKYDETNGYLFRMYSAGAVTLSGRDGSGDYISSGAGSSDVNDGLWHHLIGKVDVNTWQLWVDGIMKASYTSPSVTANFACDEPLVFGYSPIGDLQSPDWYFNGKIDDVAIYNRALSSNEIDLLKEFGL